MKPSRKPWRSFLVFFLIGIVAVLTLLPMLVELLPQQLEELGVPLTLPVELLALLSLINPLLFIVAGLLVGHFLAERTGFFSFVYEKDRYGKPLLSRLAGVFNISSLLGVMGGVIMLTVDFLLQPFLPEVLYLSDAGSTIDFFDLATRLLYGGIAEELMLRWGVMTLVVFILWKIFQRKNAQPSSVIVWSGIILSALLFGLGHYGATVAATEMTPIIFARMIFLNGLGGVIYGWLYWRKGLEAAMIAHMATHVTFVIISILTSWI
ncbi:CPBP family intramembrane glutamic endopeptidase [Alkalicoccobacillus porphyridii]|uniref:CPBP family intramembrane metalloprotease n=1 Tax=Alkalicoccobacillus porphyridii TaxID=2597270 RepID=A0A554A174_9BACI|nr:CPBP family intramembrane glutamic endopeptidase [Alkalicoccobacillus porphyridii]TSB47450.1 CPBP family intramembrane metalloprotease [Alkalicoccobacillus porphyridii]